MRELNGADRYQLYIESPTHHQHALKVVLIDRAGLRAPLTLDRLRQWVQAVFVSCPPLCWQLASPPIGRPVWVDNPVFDLEYHVNRELVAAPGGRDELAAVLARLMDQKLDRSRPLWRLWLVDGLAGDQVALVFSLHHALSDGGGTVEILSQIFDAAPDARPWSVAAERPCADPVPGAARLSAVAARGAATSLAKLPALVVRSAHSVRVNRAWPPYNVILSNVKGPSSLWFDGSPITEIQPYSQLAAGIGLNITAWTYNGKLTAGIVACPEHVPDLQDLADQLGPALAELHAAAEESFNHGAERRAATTIGVG